MDLGIVLTEVWLSYLGLRSPELLVPSLCLYSFALFTSSLLDAWA